MQRLDQPLPNDQTAEVRFRDGVPVSVRFGDPYYSLQDGAAESAHVFLGGNGLPESFRDGLQIAELGFGTGLNLLVTLAAWRRQGRDGRFRYTSFEAFPLAPAALEAALDARDVPRSDARALVAALADGARQFSLGPAEVEIIPGDARLSLPDWSGRADIWYLDGFAPARNPELWEPALLQAVAAHTAPGGRLATYTAAGAVRRALDAAGFEVARRPGFGRKRHMTVGHLR